MANTKQYRIEINGITESIDAAKSLLTQLNAIEAKIKEINALGGSLKSVKVSDVDDSATANALRTQREINKLKEEGLNLDAKTEAAQNEIYQRVDATKQVYKETVAQQKAIAAQERLTADAYSNTMVGMKQHLADLKAVIQTTDLGDGESIKKMTEEANKLNEKLKEIEQSYGQFGRNVGNYPDAAKNMQAIVVTIDGVQREFNNAREATRTLNNELKAMAVQGKENTREYEVLRQKLLELESTLNDAKRPMDSLMDTMESFTAIASASKGLGAFFGVDQTEIQKSIQQLMGLQTALKGIQAISKQIETREGVGKWIAPFTVGIDKATAKLLTFNTALLGTGKAAKIAAAGVKTFSKALKVAFSAGILIIVDLLIEGVMKLVESFKKVDDAAERQKQVMEEGAKAYAEATANISKYKTKLESFNGTKKQEKKLVEELNSAMGSSIGQYKTIHPWQEALTKKAAAYAESMKLQAQAQALLNAYSAQYVKIVAAQQDAAKGGDKWQEWLPWNWGGKSAQDKANDKVKDLQAGADTILAEYDKLNKRVEEINKKNGLFEYAPQIEKNGNKTKNAIEETQKTINQLEIKLMQEGLNKKLRQLDEEERQIINKLKQNGRKTQAEIEKIQTAYAQLRQKEINDYLTKLEISIQKSANNISKVHFEINTKDIENQIETLQNDINRKLTDRPVVNTLISRTETFNVTRGLKAEKLNAAKIYESIFNEARATNIGNKFYDFLGNYIQSKGEDVKKRFFQTFGSEDEKVFYSRLQEMFEKEYQNELMAVRNYTLTTKDTLEESFKKRLESQRKYDEDVRKEIIKSIKEQEKLNKEKIDNAEKTAIIDEQTRYESVQLPLQKEKDALEETINNFKARTQAEKDAYEQLKKDLKVIEDQMETQRQQHIDKLYQQDKEFSNKRKELELNTAKEVSSIQEGYFTEQIANYRDFQSKINELASGQPVVDKMFGVVRYNETKRQLKELQDGVKTTLNNIRQEKLKLDMLWKMGLITPEAKNTITQQLNDLETVFKQFFASITEQSKNVVPELVQSLEMYITEAVNSFSQIMSAVWTAQDNQNEKEQEQLDKMNEILEDKLSKQEEIVEKHKDKIDSIEDELSTARGDRRQHLIDQLNAEMQAQREALAQQKQIEKQKEAMQAKQDALELKRKKQQYHRDMLQAIVNGAMAVTMAAMNTWPIPAIPMMALAASTTAAQIAIMAANKPYAKGGLLEGKSHAEGGIPVGNTGIEVEGKEYIIRKKSTAPNIDVLDYINKSERKLTLDDFIDFYSGKMKKNITSMSPSKRFAEGGTIPTLNNNYTFDDRLLNAFEDYSNRPVVVSVRDINDRQAAVKNVQVLAGLNA